MEMCERCNMYESEIETDKGILLCAGCDSVRLSCINNTENPMSEEDFYKELK